MPLHLSPELSHGIRVKQPKCPNFFHNRIRNTATQKVVSERAILKNMDFLPSTSVLLIDIASIF